MTAAFICKADSCGQHRRPEYILCKRHWYMLPIGIRRRLSKPTTSKASREAAEVQALRTIWELENSVVLKWTGEL